MDNFFKYLPDIIQEAAQNPFGLFALMVIILSVLGFVFFRKSSERIRAGIFILMFIGVVSFGAVFLRATTNIIAANTTSPPQISTRDIATISPYPSNEQGLEAKPFTSAIITLSDGSIVKVLRDGFYPADLRTAEGQSISVDKMSRFDIVERSDIPPTLKIKITLINTDVITVILPVSRYDIEGQNELGGFNSDTDKIRSVEFVR
jgi:hypothetical protein